MGFDQIRQRRLSDDIVEQLEGMILEGTLKSGERLPAERALAEQFGVSRPSLREAIQKLSAKGLLVSRQGGGNYVAASLGSTFSDPLLQLLESNPEAQRDLLEFRHTLEASCAFYAALRATEMDRERLRLAFEPVSLEDLARLNEVSVRQLERLFHKHLQRTPSQYYLELRLARARSLLLRSESQVRDIALACGFVSAAHFSKCYSRLFGVSPIGERKQVALH